MTSKIATKSKHMTDPYDKGDIIRVESLDHRWWKILLYKLLFMRAPRIVSHHTITDIDSITLTVEPKD